MKYKFLIFLLVFLIFINYIHAETTTFLKSGPNNLVNLEETDNYYKLSNDFIGVEIYKNNDINNKYYNQNFSRLLINDEEFILEHYNNIKGWVNYNSILVSTNLEETPFGYSIDKKYLGANILNGYDIIYTLERGRPIKVKVKINSVTNETYRIHWILNGIYGENLIEDSNILYYGNKTNMLSSAETETGNIWQANVTVNDGTKDSKPVESNYLKIL